MRIVKNIKKLQVVYGTDKMKKTNSVLGNSIIYTFGNLLLKACSFFLIPLYTSYLSTEEYGIINLASGFYGLAASIITLSLQYALIRYYADYKNDKKKVSKMFGTAITFILLIGIVFIFVSSITTTFWASIFFKDVLFFPVILLSILISVVSGLYNVYQDILKGMQQAKASMILSYTFFFLLLFGNVIAIAVLHLGANGIIFSTLVVYCIMVVIMIIDLYRQQLLSIGIDVEILKKMLTYSIPLIPHTIAFNIQTYASRIIINEKLSLSMLGIYSLASQFGGVADVILNSVQSAFQPWMYGILNENSNKSIAKLRNNTYLLMWLYGLAYILIGAFSQEAVLIMANDCYKEAWVYIPAIVLSIALKSPLYFYLNFLYYNKTKTKYVFISTVVGCIVNICLTIMFTPVLQIFGSILADVIAMVCRLVITLLVVRNEAGRIYSFWKLQFRAILPMFFMIAALIPSLEIYKNVISIYNIIWKTIIVIVYLLIVVFVDKDRLQSIIRMRRDY